MNQDRFLFLYPNDSLVNFLHGEQVFGKVIIVKRGSNSIQGKIWLLRGILHFWA